MKALIIAENQDAAAEMGAAARGFADEVVALGIGTDLAGVADKSLKVSVPDDRIVEDAWATVCAIADAEQPARVLVEPTTRLSGVAGRLAAHMGAAVITDVHYRMSLALIRDLAQAGVRVVCCERRRGRAHGGAGR